MSKPNGNESDIRILLLNPNSSTSMTDGMLAAARNTPISKSVQLDVYTAPLPSPASIDNDQDIAASSDVVLNDILNGKGPNLADYDAVLVACFSVHSLVSTLPTHSINCAVTGIFEASVLTALSIISSSTSAKWGIVTTGTFWEKHLSVGAADFLGHDRSTVNRKFAGVYSTGLNAGDFHTVSPEAVRQKLDHATKQLLGAGDITCVVMGCGGMAGLEDIIRSAATEMYGRERAGKLYIVDGVKAGVLQLHQTIHSRRTFS